MKLLIKSRQKMNVRNDVKCIKRVKGLKRTMQQISNRKCIIMTLEKLTISISKIPFENDIFEFETVIFGGPNDTARKVYSGVQPWEADFDQTGQFVIFWSFTAGTLNTRF